jgi:hypothetical protein
VLFSIFLIFYYLVNWKTDKHLFVKIALPTHLIIGIMINCFFIIDIFEITGVVIKNLEMNVTIKV